MGLKSTALKYSTHKNTKPAFPVCNEAGESLMDSTPLEVLQLSPSSIPATTGTGFLALKRFSIRDSVLQTFVELGQLAYSMHILMPYRDDILSRDRLTDARNLVQYRFSSLPIMTDDAYLICDPQTEEGGEHSMDASILKTVSTIYGMCWLVGHLFTTHVTFPVPSCRRFRLKTVPPLYDIVENTEDILNENPVFMKLQLWCVVIGGIAAEDIDPGLRRWAVLKIRDLCRKLCLREWEQVKAVMCTFAWMESACNHGGEELWAEVQTTP